jgi:hypothetical protein
VKPATSIEKAANMRGRLWLQALAFFAIFVPTWLLLNAITGVEFSGESLRSAVIAGVVAAGLYWLFMYFYEKRKNRS